jgi:hypothetical protein
VALEALAVAAPGWLAGVIGPSWQQVYGARIDDLHLRESQGGRQDLMVRYGTDGYYLLEQAHGPGAPGWLLELPPRSCSSPLPSTSLPCKPPKPPTTAPPAAGYEPAYANPLIMPAARGQAGWHLLS